MRNETAKNAKQLETTRQRLLTERARFQGQGARIGQHLREGIPADSQDQAQALVNDEVMNTLDENGRAELAKIESALVRLDNGSYGKCSRCGADIDERRMEVLPTTEQCRTCADR